MIEPFHNSAYNHGKERVLEIQITISPPVANLIEFFFDTINKVNALAPEMFDKFLKLRQRTDSPGLVQD